MINVVVVVFLVVALSSLSSFFVVFPVVVGLTAVAHPRLAKLTRYFIIFLESFFSSSVYGREPFCASPKK